MASALIDGLKKQKPKEFEKTIAFLNTYVMGDKPGEYLEFYDIVSRDIQKVYFPTYVRNAVEFFVFVLKNRPKHGVAVVKLAKTFCQIDATGDTIIAFKPFLRFLPSVTHLECRSDILDLLNRVFRQRNTNESSIVNLNLDVSSFVDKQEFPDFIGYKGSISSLHHVVTNLCSLE